MGITGLVAVLTLVGVLAFYVTTAHGSGSGGGGSCFPTTGPACTYKGNSSFSDFQTVSSDGCIYTDAEVSVYNSLSRPGEVATQSVFLYISKWDSCNDVPLVEAANFDPNTGIPNFTGTVAFDGNLVSATVNGTASMYDEFTGNLLFTTSVNVTAKGYGPISSFSNSYRYSSPGFKMNSRSSGTSRPAEGSGTFTDEAGNNLAATPTLSADVENASGGTVQISKQ